MRGSRRRTSNVSSSRSASVSEPNRGKQAPEHANELAVRPDGVGHELEARLRVGVRLLDVPLRFGERSALREELRDQTRARVAGVRDVAGLLGRGGRAPDQLEPGRQVFRPGNDRGREVQVHGCLEAREAVLLDQIEPELAEAEPLRVVAEAAPEHRGQADIGQARGVAVSVRDAEPGDTPDQQIVQVRVRDQGGRDGRLEDIHRRQPVGVADRRQIDEGFDGTVSERSPERRVLVGHLGLRRVWRPFDADLPQVAEGGLDGAGAAVRRVKDLDLGAGDGGAVGEGPRAPGQRGEPRSRRPWSCRSGARIRPD